MCNHNNPAQGAVPEQERILISRDAGNHLKPLWGSIATGSEGWCGGDASIALIFAIVVLR
ncbi:MAG TPA: hypothetical protein DCY88_07020 [Cyanobacteria bacterium UBA11372]|nr:hypothetical protein [Cyanobacteria bacterium UBA11372]